MNHNSPKEKLISEKLSIHHLRVSEVRRKRLLTSTIDSKVHTKNGKYIKKNHFIKRFGK